MALSTEQLAEVHAAVAASRLPGPPSDQGTGRRTSAVATLSPAQTPENRRHAPRIRRRCNAEVSEWLGNRAGTAFGVAVEDISTAGVGIVHTGRLNVGRQYLLEIPRPHRRPLAILFTVVRCDQRDGGLFEVEIAPDEILSVAADHCRDGDDADPASGNATQYRPSRLRLTMLVAAFAIAVAAVFSGLV